MTFSFNRNLLIIDVETTGADPNVHEAVDFAAILLDRQTLDPLRQFQSFIRPDRFEYADPRALAIHGLTAAVLETAPTAAEVLRDFLGLFETDYTLAGWNIGFDTQFFRSLFVKAGLSGEFEKIDYHRLDLWSVLQVGWVTHRIPNEPKSLNDVCAALQIARPTIHTALADALIAAEVLKKTVATLREESNEEFRSGRTAAATNV